MLSLDLRGGHNHYKFNKDLFKKWSPEMAHVLGFLYADGNITDSVASRAQYIHFYSTDRHILESIRATMASSHVIEVILPKTANFNIRNIYSGSGAHYLKYSTSESIEWFKFLYSKDMSDLFLKRKFEIFSAYFQLRPIKKDSIIEEMLR